ncbi:YopX family protein [Lactiplantibacillus plantarum]|uniref:YopX family protein n=2 Tax=Lactiplantibacillus plantarum TaxID=1590 RepID=UPI003C20F9B3
MAPMIKFRAWYMPFGKYGAMQEMVYSRASHILALAETEPEKYIPEQFTGLKDVDGMEIYVGDVVQPVRVIENCPELNNWISRVGKPFLVKNRNYVHGKWIARSVADKGFGVDDWNLGPELLIVGNVHENPELLEESK